jgi:hypothetical protein
MDDAVQAVFILAGSFSAPRIYNAICVPKYKKVS